MYMVLILLGFIIGCGSSEGGSSEAVTSEDTGENYTSFYVASKDEIGECRADRKNHLYYVSDDNAFYGCDGSEWAEIKVGVETVKTIQEKLVVDDSDPYIWEDGDLEWKIFGIQTDPFSGGELQCEANGWVTPSPEEIDGFAARGGWFFFEPKVTTAKFFVTPPPTSLTEIYGIYNMVGQTVANYKAPDIGSYSAGVICFK